MKGELRAIKTVDSHTEGNPTRVIVKGVPTPPGDSLFERISWLKSNDYYRKILNHEPRGGGLMCSVLLMDPIEHGSDFSIIIMEQEGYVPMCGHCAIGVATTVVAENYVTRTEPNTVVRLDTPAGLVEANVEVVDGIPVKTTITNVPSFLYDENVVIHTSDFGKLLIDIVYGGDFYAVVNADELGLHLEAYNESKILNAAQQVREAVRSQLEIVHPDNENINECYQVQFISNKTSFGNIRNTVVAPPGSMDRSPCGTGSSGLVARALTKGQIQVGEEYIVEGPLNTSFVGRALEKEHKNNLLYVRPQITGRAFITGYHEFVLNKNDPFPAGYQVGVQD